MQPRLLEILNTVRANKGRAPLADATADASLREDFGFDSMDLAEMTVRIEEAFDVDVFADGLVATVGELEAKLPGA